MSSSGKFQFANASQLTALNRLCGSLDALARHHSVSKGAKRQHFVATMAPLQVRCNIYTTTTATAWSSALLLYSS